MAADRLEQREGQPGTAEAALLGLYPRDGAGTMAPAGDARETKSWDL